MKAKTKKLLVVGGAVAGVYLLSRYLSGKSLLGGFGSSDPYLDALNAKVEAKTPAENAAADAAMAKALQARSDTALAKADLQKYLVTAPAAPTGGAVVAPAAPKPGVIYPEAAANYGKSSVSGSTLLKYGIPLALAAGLIYWFVLRKKPVPASAPTV